MSIELDADRLLVLVHELRSPVAAMSAIAETVADPELGTDTRSELVRLAIAACGAIERIVADVAVASIRLEPVDLESLVRDSVAAARLRGASIELQLADALPSIRADPARLRQALDNLIANALVHGSSASAGPVRLRASADDVVRISVSDSGRGIAAGDQDRIFDVGVSLDPATGGAGIGLALTRAIVEGHGGILSLTSRPGAGATFTLVLPMSRP